jgi:hypothetical protein
MKNDIIIGIFVTILIIVIYMLMSFCFKANEIKLSSVESQIAEKSLIQ